MGRVTNHLCPSLSSHRKPLPEINYNWNVPCTTHIKRILAERITNLFEENFKIMTNKKSACPTPCGTRRNVTGNLVQSGWIAWKIVLSEFCFGIMPSAYLDGNNKPSQAICLCISLRVWIISSTLPMWRALNIFFQILVLGNLYFLWRTDTIVSYSQCKTDYKEHLKNLQVKCNNTVVYDLHKFMC